MARKVQTTLTKDMYDHVEALKEYVVIEAYQKWSIKHLKS